MNGLLVNVIVGSRSVFDVVKFADLGSLVRLQLIRFLGTLYNEEICDGISNFILLLGMFDPWHLLQLRN